VHGPPCPTAWVRPAGPSYLVLPGRACPGIGLSRLRRRLPGRGLDSPGRRAGPGRRVPGLRTLCRGLPDRGLARAWIRCNPAGSRGRGDAGMLAGLPGGRDARCPARPVPERAHPRAFAGDRGRGWRTPGGSRGPRFLPRLPDGWRGRPAGKRSRGGGRGPARGAWRAPVAASAPRRAALAHGADAGRSGRFRTGGAGESAGLPDRPDGAHRGGRGAPAGGRARASTTRGTPAPPRGAGGAPAPARGPASARPRGLVAGAPVSVPGGRDDLHRPPGLRRRLPHRGLELGTGRMPLARGSAGSSSTPRRASPAGSASRSVRPARSPYPRAGWPGRPDPPSPRTRPPRAP
jgi:hypothetical protein